MKFSQVNFIII